MSGGAGRILGPLWSLASPVGAALEGVWPKRGLAGVLWGSVWFKAFGGVCDAGHRPGVGELELTGLETLALASSWIEKAWLQRISGSGRPKRVRAGRNWCCCCWLQRFWRRPSTKTSREFMG